MSGPTPTPPLFAYGGGVFIPRKVTLKFYRVVHRLPSFTGSASLDRTMLLNLGHQSPRSMPGKGASPLPAPHPISPGLAMKVPGFIVPAIHSIMSPLKLHT